MGIKHFWIWFKENFGDDIATHNMSRIHSVNIDVDTLAIDMNGIFHTCAQKVYKYGNFAPFKKKLLHHNTRRKEQRLFAAIANTVDFYRRLVNPKKRLLLCVDGVAGQAKMTQQRQRRFRSAKESNSKGFDPNCITPGTRFMDNLSRYLDWYIRCQISSSPEWKSLEVILSNEKVPGEGEHKIVNYLRQYRKIGESCCIHGMDADLIMLGLAAPCEKIFILRDDSFNMSLTHVVNLSNVRKKLGTRLVNHGKYTPKNINDFLLMCYTVGNDFLPHAPGIEILTGGIDSLIEVYKEVEEEFGCMSRKFKGRLRFSKKSFSTFLKNFSELEEELLNIKLNKGKALFPDPILEAATLTDAKGVKKVDLQIYKKLYYEEKFPGVVVKKLCAEYIQGMRWVLDYYTSGIPSWSWYYPYHYAPFLSDVAVEMESFKTTAYPTDDPLFPFEQLMTVLPEKSSKLLPPQIGELMREDSEELGRFFPAEFKIDMAGKRREWEGIVLLPQVDTKLFLEQLKLVMPNVDGKHKRRNIRGGNFKYEFSQQPLNTFRSFYGDITNNNCRRSFVNF